MFRALNFTTTFPLSSPFEGERKCGTKQKITDNLQNDIFNNIYDCHMYYLEIYRIKEMVVVKFHDGCLFSSQIPRTLLWKYLRMKQLSTDSIKRWSLIKIVILTKNAKMSSKDYLFIESIKSCLILRYILQNRDKLVFVNYFILPRSMRQTSNVLFTLERRLTFIWLL